MGFFETIGSILTGGLSDAVLSAYNTIAHSNTRDWQKLLTSGMSETGYGLEQAYNGDKLGGFLTSLGSVSSVTNNPFVNASDDYLTRNGTIFQRLLNDAGVMPDDVYDKNYKYTKEIAHIVGMAYAGGASSLLTPTDAAVSAAAEFPTASSEYIAEAVRNQTMKAISDVALTTAGKAAAKIGTDLFYSNPVDTRRSYEDLKNYQKLDAQYKYQQKGLLKTEEPPLNINTQTTPRNINFEKTAIPELSRPHENKEKEIAEVLTDEYKNYKLNDYMLYKQDPEKLKDIILKYGDN